MPSFQSTYCDTSTSSIVIDKDQQNQTAYADDTEKTIRFEATEAWHTEVDFIYCSDIDNGFIAKVEYIDGIVEEVGEDYRIEPGLSGSNISAKISIKRITGKNPDKTKIRGLLKQAMKYYTSLSTFSADIGNITVRQMVLFIDTLILDGRKNAIAAGSDYNYRNTVLTSIAFLEAIKKELIGV